MAEEKTQRWWFVVLNNAVFQRSWARSREASINLMEACTVLEWEELERKGAYTSSVYVNWPPKKEMKE